MVRICLRSVMFTAHSEQAVRAHAYAIKEDIGFSWRVYWGNYEHIEEH